MPAACRRVPWSAAATEHSLQRMLSREKTSQVLSPLPDIDNKVKICYNIVMRPFSLSEFLGTDPNEITPEAFNLDMLRLGSALNLHLGFKKN